jgi:hypothetical protein
MHTKAGPKLRMRIHVSEKLRDDNLSPGERDSLETVRKKTQTNVKTAEKCRFLLLTFDFRLRVQDQISSLNDSGNGVESVTWTTGLFQAVSQIENLLNLVMDR